MNEVVESVKNNPGMVAMFSLFMLSSGVTFYSEGDEEEETQLFTAEFREADRRQNEDHDEFDDLYHDLDKRLALVELQMCLMTQANIPNCD